MKFLLDTCALIWWTLDQNHLSPQTLKTLNENDLYVSSISIWELGLKAKNKKLDIGMAIQTYVAKLKELSNLCILAIDEVIWLKNLALDWDHRDPADRCIVATADMMDAWIVTTDQRILSFYGKTRNCHA